MDGWMVSRSRSLSQGRYGERRCCVQVQAQEASGRGGADQHSSREQRDAQEQARGLGAQEPHGSGPVRIPVYIYKCVLGFLVVAGSHHFGCPWVSSFRLSLGFNMLMFCCRCILDGVWLSYQMIVLSTQTKRGGRDGLVVESQALLGSARDSVCWLEFD